MATHRGALVFCILALCALGTVMIYSASAPTADRLTGDQDATLIKHLFWLGLGVCAFLATSCLDWRRTEAAAPWIFGIAAAFLVCVLVPGVGSTVNGARRWFRYGDMSFQPSEFMKLGLPLFLAWWLGRDPERAKSFKRGFLPAAGAIALAAGLTAVEPDLGTAALLAAAGGLVALLGGIRLAHAVPSVLTVLPVAGAAAYHKFSHARDRILVFMDPDADPLGRGYQIKQALLGLGAGGATGQGIGLSKQKLFFLPEKHTDFIFAILGEELGFVGTAGVLALFLFLLWNGRAICRKAESSFASLAAAGILMTVGLQAAMNIAVVTASMPTKGISLPFLSFGGSGLFFTLAGMGFVVSIAREPVDPAPAEETKPHISDVPEAPPAQEAA